MNEVLQLDSNLAKELIEQINFAAENNMFSMIKRLTGYGTWTVTAFVNEYHFLGYSDFLKKFKTITHDEDYSEESFMWDVEVYIKEGLFELVTSQEGSEW